MKNILITGSTDGIGKLTAIKLAEEGHSILIHGRSKTKVAAVISEIKMISKNENISGFVADFSDLDAVERMAQQVLSELSQLDVLINNAGVFKSVLSDNKDDLDMRFVVNYFAPYVLTNKLLPLLNKGNEPLLINLSSAAQAALSYAALRGTAPISVNDAYAQSKLALTMWSTHVAKENENLVVIAVNPGSLLNTKMVNEAYGTHWSPAEKGANILFELALSEEHKTSSGKYFNNDKGAYSLPHSDAYNTEAIKKLMEVTNELVG